MEIRSCIKSRFILLFTRSFLQGGGNDWNGGRKLKESLIFPALSYAREQLP